jgi:predicted Na+-dependent transporter
MRGRLSGAICASLDASARSGSVLLATGLIGGIVLPPVAHVLRHALPFSVAGMTALVFLRVDISAVVEHLRRPSRVIAVLAMSMVGCPLIAWTVVPALPLNRGITNAIVIFATGAAMMSAPALARLLDLDPELALISAVVSTLLTPLIAPTLIWVLTGTDLGLGIREFAARLAAIILIPLAVSVVFRRLIGAARLETLASQVDGLVIWLLIIFAFGAMDGIGIRFLASPVSTVTTTLVAFLVVIAFNLMTQFALLPFGLQFAATAGMLSGFRAMGAYLASLPETADPNIALFFGLYQIPLYLGPLVMKPLYRRMLQFSDEERAKTADR